MKYKHSESQIISAVKNSLSIAQVCRILNIKPCGGNYKTLKQKFKLWKIDISHFTGAAWNQGEKFINFSKKIPLREILVKNSTYGSTTHLKHRLFKEGYKKEICEKCGIVKWNNKKISFELDHVNGINNDNRIENLRILCPNCHSQTPTWKGKNKKTNKNKITDTTLINSLLNSTSIRQALLTVGLAAKGGNYVRCKRLMIENKIIL